MYKSFFKLKINPFASSPDPRFLYMMPHTREALATLEYGISAHKGFIVLTGEVVSTSSWSTFIGVKLKGVADQPVECVFRSETKRDKKFIPGAKLKMYAEYDDNGTRLMNCELISK